MNLSICDSVPTFSAASNHVFCQPVTGREVTHTLGQLRQGSNHVFDHAIRFHTLVAESWWNVKALADTLYLSLSEVIDRIVMVDGWCQRQLCDDTSNSLRSAYFPGVQSCTDASHFPKIAHASCSFIGASVAQGVEHVIL